MGTPREPSPFSFLTVPLRVRYRQSAEETSLLPPSTQLDMLHETMAEALRELWKGRACQVVEFTKLGMSGGYS